MSGDSEEMIPAFPVRQALIHKAQVGFVDQHGGLERHHLAFIAQIPRSEPSQRVVDQRD